MSDFFSGSRHQIDVIAHRGGKGEAPEETLVAFANAKQLGVDVLEMDIRVTSDGELVLMHNPTVRATTNGWLPVRCYRLAELQKLDAAYKWNPDGLPEPPHRGEGIIVPTFRQVLEQFHDMRMNIEIKGWHPFDAKKIAKKFCDLLVEFEMTERVLIASFHSPVLRVIRREFPKVAISASTFEVIRFVVSSRWGTGDYRPNVAAIETSSKSIDRRLVETAKKHGLKLHAFTVNEVDDMKRLIALGVDGIITDFPTRLLELLSSRTPSSS
jgi:glycerophosphoryl diester phosphodiesterase